MSTSSLCFYRKATALRPYDARMWCAMAGCYKQLARTQEAIQCYKRAVGNDDSEGIALQELARLYKEEGTEQAKGQAAFYYTELLKQREEQHDMAGPEAPDAQMFRPPATTSTTSATLHRTSGSGSAVVPRALAQG